MRVYLAIVSRTGHQSSSLAVLPAAAVWIGGLEKSLSLAALCLAGARNRTAGFTSMLGNSSQRSTTPGRAGRAACSPPRRFCSSGSARERQRRATRGLERGRRPGRRRREPPQLPTPKATPTQAEGAQRVSFWCYDATRAMMAPSTTLAVCFSVQRWSGGRGRSSCWRASC